MKAIVIGDENVYVDNEMYDKLTALIENKSVAIRILGTRYGLRLPILFDYTLKKKGSLASYVVGKYCNRKIKMSYYNRNPMDCTRNNIYWEPKHNLWAAKGILNDYLSGTFVSLVRKGSYHIYIGSFATLKEAKEAQTYAKIAWQRENLPELLKGMKVERDKPLLPGVVREDDDYEDE